MVKPSYVLGNRVLVQPKKKQERTQGGIIIPLNVNQNLEEAIVLSIGEQVIQISQGDTILYPSGAGIPYEIDGTEYKFIDGPTKDSVGNIIAII
jgi:co-chaperonin GroES (HSP10)